MNVPDDWYTYWEICGTCGARYHESEYCERCDDAAEQQEMEETDEASEAPTANACGEPDDYIPGGTEVIG